MSKLKMVLNFTFCVLVSVLIASDNCLAQKTAVASKKVDLAQMPLEKVCIKEENIGELFSHLSFAYEIPLGLEIARGGDEPTFYRIDFQNGTLSDLLTQFVTEHEEYAWKIENGVLSIFPKEDYRDPLLRELLLTEISSFSVPEKTTAWTFGKNLLATPEIRRILEPYGMTYDTGYLGGFYIQQLGQQYSFDVSSMRLKSILDKVVKESPVARNWIISHNRHMLSLRVNAQPEYSPKDLYAPAFKRQNSH